ncbi:MAG: tRNA uridine(34) 5-carboxymethylaminomethyl modification radical SAM/GNAT enzyme Elp3 [bacterium]
MNLEKSTILLAIEKKIKNKTGFDRLRQSVSSAFRVSQPSNQSILKEYRALLKNKKIGANPELEKILKTREVRTLSGVAIITVLTKPFPCPGACIYCPTDARMPKSYLPKEPAAARALMLKFNPYEQVKQRILALENNGHDTEKIELIVKGGTWSAYPQKYQNWFIKRCFEAANSITPPTPSYLKRGNKTITPPLKVRGGWEGLCQAQKINETAKHRIVGLTLETRPDFVTPEEIKHLRALGCTRIELGAQTIDDKILKLVRRGHTAKDTANATALLRDAGFKVDYHLMPALPGVSQKNDLENFKEIFKNPAYRPDMIKIYPCSVIPKTILYKWWKEKKYKPMATKTLADLIIKMKLATPRYVRISRVIRDIPADDISAGNKVTNLRQYIAEEMKKRGLVCKCIRCREIGHQKFQISNFKFQIFIKKYKAANGTECFLSIENPKRNALFAFCRLRLPQKQKNMNTKIVQLLPELQGAALIRELHTYGHLVPVNTKLSGASQHTGFGKKLMQEAEAIAKKAGYKKMAVIAGIGVREYYKKLGYGLKGTYVVKNMQEDEK